MMISNSTIECVCPKTKRNESKNNEIQIFFFCFFAVVFEKEMTERDNEREDAIEREHELIQKVCFA